MHYIFGFSIIFSWLLGIVFSSGFNTFIAVVFPPYSWYLVVEHLVTKYQF